MFVYAFHECNSSNEYLHNVSIVEIKFWLTGQTDKLQGFNPVSLTTRH